MASSNQPKKRTELDKIQSTLSTAWHEPKEDRRHTKARAATSSSAPGPQPSPPSNAKASFPPVALSAPRQVRRSPATASHRQANQDEQVITAQQDDSSTRPATPSIVRAGMSQSRNRPRSSVRSSEAAHGEELQLWQNCQVKLAEVIDMVNESSQNGIEIIRQDRLAAEAANAKAQLGKKVIPTSEAHEIFTILESKIRAGVKVNEALLPAIVALIEGLMTLSAVVKSKENEQKLDLSTSRAAAQRTKESTAASSSVYDFDAVESPVPSPNPGPVPRRLGGSSGGSKADRDSMPPKMERSTPSTMAGSVEPQTALSAGGTRQKMSFVKGDEVAFQPKLPSGEQMDWILGRVKEVKGEGKTRRYRVLDVDAEAGNQKEFRTSANKMILIPKTDAGLPPLDKGRTVLALYPQTTTFYKAEVVGMTLKGEVNLKFEGEESSDTTQPVTRRHVLEYRG